VPRPFKKFFCDREDVFSLPNAAFKVWMYHYKCERADRKSWPSAQTIAEKCQISIKTVWKQRQWLADNGWLKRVEKRSVYGEFEIPVFTVVRGDRPPKKVRRSDSPKRGVPQSQKGEYPTEEKGSTPSPKMGHEVDVEVDSKVEGKVEMSSRIRKTLGTICETMGVAPDHPKSRVWQEIEMVYDGRAKAGYDVGDELRQFLSDNLDIQKNPVEAFLKKGVVRHRCGAEVVSTGSETLANTIVGYMAAEGVSLDAKQLAELKANMAAEPRSSSVPFEIYKSAIQQFIAEANGDQFLISRVAAKTATSLVARVLHDPEKRIIKDYELRKSIAATNLDEERKLREEAEARLARIEREEREAEEEGI
jgi:hypothetical protein